ncbi:fungal-specific transcription factor domain-containing protein [Phyllosticta citricarpa]|uniref:Fungal-specific transcription factor domain-containing protein n=1 Tax=Phyllosticta citricarpa TaxID=55181 RepID=A0ABR1L2D5_9PEZI
MYHTFQATTAGVLKAPGDGGDALGGKHLRPQGSRRITTTNACVECRRRKIRCDGQQPCGQCLWYQHPQNCSYAKPAQRVIPSRKLVEKLQRTIDQQKRILERLFPGKDVDSLNSTSREELINLALTLPAPPASSPSESGTQTAQSVQTPDDEDVDNLGELFETTVLETPASDESRRHAQGPQQGLSDSVNGLEYDDEQPDAYVGMSSMQAAIKAMQRCAPEREILKREHGVDTVPPGRREIPPVLGVVYPDYSYGMNWLDHYMEKVHSFFPMVDMEQLRMDFTSQHRQDAAWFVLMNIVMALGCLASSTQDNDYHLIFFERARQYLSLESLGSMNIELVQALGIMAGYYMHWLNRPNEASALMGAVMRMATGLGLHREYSVPATRRQGRTSKSRDDNRIAEMRRRTWWGLFCLDVWGSTTTSRPSLGRINSAVSVLPPGKISEEPGNTPHRQDMRALALTHNVDFCRIATRIQDTLATNQLLKYEEIEPIDNDLVAWREGLPSILTNFDEECEPFLRIPRLVMKWRYQNLRIVLHRPILLHIALKRTPYAMLSAEEKVAVGRIRVIAGQNIKDMSEECTMDLISGWNAVWFCHQACLIPLISLFSDLSNMEEVVKWQGQIETALDFFEKIKDYSVAARKTKEWIARIYEESKLHLEQVTQAARCHMEAQKAWHQQQQQQQQIKFEQQEPTKAETLNLDGQELLQQPVQAEVPLRQPPVRPDMHLPMSEAQYIQYVTAQCGQNFSQPHFIPGTAAPAPFTATGLDDMSFWSAQQQQQPQHYQQAAPQSHQYHQQHQPTSMTEQSGPSSLGSFSNFWNGDMVWDRPFEFHDNSVDMFVGMDEYQSPAASVGSGGDGGGGGGMGGPVPAGTAQRAGLGMGSSRPGTGVQGAWGLG